jgi:hypothetical protein
MEEYPFFVLLLFTNVESLNWTIITHDPGPYFAGLTFLVL